MILQPQPLFLLILPRHWPTGYSPACRWYCLRQCWGQWCTWTNLWHLGLTLLIGTPVLSLIGAIGAALTLGLRSAGVLLSLLIIPLYIPVLIFGTGTVAAAAEGAPVAGYLALMGAFLVLALTLAPFAAAAALRISMSNS